MNLGMPPNGNAALVIRHAVRARTVNTPNMVWQRTTIKLTAHRRTAQCELCVNYDCPMGDIPDSECGYRMEAPQ